MVRACSAPWGAFPRATHLTVNTKQRGGVTCLRSPSQGVAELEQEPGAPDCISAACRWAPPPPSGWLPGARVPGADCSPPLHTGCCWILNLPPLKGPGLPGRQTLSTQHSGPHSSARGPPAWCPSLLSNSPLVHLQVCFSDAAPGHSQPPPPPWQGWLTSRQAPISQAPKCPCTFALARPLRAGYRGHLQHEWSASR